LASYIKKGTQTDGVDELGAVDSVQWGNNVGGGTVKCEAL
jgi:hypothetical protein